MQHRFYFAYSRRQRISSVITETERSRPIVLPVCLPMRFRSLQITLTIDHAYRRVSVPWNSRRSQKDESLRVRRIQRIEPNCPVSLENRLRGWTMRRYSVAFERLLEAFPTATSHRVEGAWKRAAWPLSRKHGRTGQREDRAEGWKHGLRGVSIRIKRFSGSSPSVSSVSSSSSLSLDSS